MPITFIHLSDIHFGQERGSQIIVHDDVKERLVEDAGSLVKAHAQGRANGVIITGDIAYSGKREEYLRAAEWLDRLTSATGCEQTHVQVVPGNHDIDVDAISSGCKLMLEDIAAKGEARLDSFLERGVDREVLYERFGAYRPFAEGYDCPLDHHGGAASDRSFELAPLRTLRFIGLNSALICSGKDQRGRLLLGARQHVLPRNAGEELVVLSHHPLHWLQDSVDARRYIRSRARVFVSGHEHDPSVHVEEIKTGCDLLTLTAGATVPPKADDKYTYTYNLLRFDWDAATDGLRMMVIPRVWSPEETTFGPDASRLGEPTPTYVLGCPNFRNGGREGGTASAPAVVPEDEMLAGGSTIERPTDDGRGGDEVMEDQFPLLLLRFFRDLTPAQRLQVLLTLKAVPEDLPGPLTHTIERQVVDALAKTGRLAELETAINDIANRDGESTGGRS